MWARLLIEAEAAVTGPLDEIDLEANGDPTSLLGEEDESGFDEMGDLPDEESEDDDFEDWSEFYAEGDEDADEGDDEEE